MVIVFKVLIRHQSWNKVITFILLKFSMLKSNFRHLNQFRFSHHLPGRTKSFSKKICWILDWFVSSPCNFLLPRDLSSLKLKGLFLLCRLKERHKTSYMLSEVSLSELHLKFPLSNVPGSVSSLNLVRKLLVQQKRFFIRYKANLFVYTRFIFSSSVTKFNFTKSLNVIKLTSISKILDGISKLMKQYQ